MTLISPNGVAVDAEDGSVERLLAQGFTRPSSEAAPDAGKAARGKPKAASAKKAHAAQAR